MAFLHETDEDRLFISVITLGELRRGVALKTDGRMKSVLDAWLRIDLRERFSGRIVDITAPIAELWGELMADFKQRGIALNAMGKNGFLAATARAQPNARDPQRQGLRAFLVAASYLGWRMNFVL